jgi:hypothetical protein
MGRGVDLQPVSAPPEIDMSDSDGAIEAMVEWFHENFEDPAMETPYESAEGGYQYIWGGPHYAREELWDAFPTANEELIERAAGEIQVHGIFDWAPAGSRIRESDLDVNDAVETSLEDRLEALKSQIDEIEGYIDFWRKRDPQIGHNGPPDEFRLQPEDADLEAAATSVVEIRAELAKGDPANSADPAVIEKAESAFQRLANKIWGWVKAGAGALALGAVGGVGKHYGEELAKDPTAFWEVLDAASSTLSTWAGHLGGIL